TLFADLWRWVRSQKWWCRTSYVLEFDTETQSHGDTESNEDQDFLLEIRPNGFSGRRHTDGPQRTTGRDKQSLEIVATKGAVGGFVTRDRNEIEELAFLREHIDAGGEFVLDFEWRVLFVEARGDEQPARGVELHSVRS